MQIFGQKNAKKKHFYWEKRVFSPFLPPERLCKDNLCTLIGGIVETQYKYT